MDFTQAESVILNHIAAWDSLQYLKDAMKVIREAQDNLTRVTQDVSVLTDKVQVLTIEHDTLEQSIAKKTQALLVAQAGILDAEKTMRVNQHAKLLTQITEAQAKFAQLEQDGVAIAASVQARVKELDELNNRIAIGEKFLGVVLAKRDALAKSLQEVQ